MSKYLKKFENHTQYDTYINGSGAILPNISLCVNENEVHYNDLVCEETSVYEIIGTPSYPSTIEGYETSFDITVNYERTDTNSNCKHTITDGTDTITVECGRNTNTYRSRTVTGTVDYHGNEIEYRVTQSKYVSIVTAKYNVTDTSSPTQIGYSSYTTGFTAIEIDGVVQPSVVSAYTFNTTGEHTVKYTMANATRINMYAFMECTSLTSIEAPTEVYDISDSAFKGCTSLESIDIPGLMFLGKYAFMECTSLTSIDIPSNVSNINQHSFYGCSGLTSVTLSSGVISISKAAFYGCSSLPSINIPDSVTTIGDNAFGYCTGLTSCTIGSGVTSIGNDAFRNCSSLTSCTIGSGVTSIGNSAFIYCTSLPSINIPDSVTTIGDSTFSYCSGLTSITIPNGVTTINDSAFNYCRGLISITIGSGVTSIGNTALQGCSSLTSITSNALTAPTLGSYTFYGVKTGGTLYVPIGSTGYDEWMNTSPGHLGYYNWTKVEQ